MNKRPSWDTLPGTTPEEKFLALGIVPEKEIDIRTLALLSNQHAFPAYLFFEEDLARSRPLAAVLEEYREVDEFERPLIRVDSFLRFTRENDPSFEQTLREFPLMVRIVTAGAAPLGPGQKPVPCVTGLMPFLDELDVESKDLPAPVLK